jgi:hypothetical protein
MQISGFHQAQVGLIGRGMNRERVESHKTGGTGKKRAAGKLSGHKAFLFCMLGRVCPRSLTVSRSLRILFARRWQAGVQTAPCCGKPLQKAQKNRARDWRGLR